MLHQICQIHVQIWIQELNTIKRCLPPSQKPFLSTYDGIDLCDNINEKNAHLRTCTYNCIYKSILSNYQYVGSQASCRQFHMRHVFASLFLYFGENVNNGWLNHSEQVFIMTSFLYFITFNNGYNGTFRITTVTHECMLKFTYHQIMFPPGCHYTRILCTGMFRLLAQPGR